LLSTAIHALYVIQCEFDRLIHIPRDWLPWWNRATGLIERCGDNATRTQHVSPSGLLCTPATGDYDCLTEDDASGSTGLHDLSQMNGE